MHDDTYCPFLSSLPIKANLIFNNFTAKNKLHLDLQILACEHVDLRAELPKGPSTAYRERLTRTSLKLSREELNHSVWEQLRFSNHCLLFWALQVFWQFYLQTCPLLTASLMLPKYLHFCAYKPWLIILKVVVFVWVFLNALAKWKQMQAPGKINPKQPKGMSA